MKLYFATKNLSKLKEVQQILNNVELCTILDIEKELNTSINIEETGSSYEQNALIKAREIYKISGKAVFADDSGFEIDCLGKQPGIHSARFLEHLDYKEKNQIILDVVKNVQFEKRTARFVCAIAFITSENGVIKERVFKQTVEGYVPFEAKGTNGFGYDPIFLYKEFDKTFAELTTEQKNLISHRAKALNNLKGFLTL